MLLQKITTLVVILLAGFGQAQAQYLLAGTVIDGQTKEPLVGATVLLLPTGAGSITDHNGQFALPGAAPGDSIEISYVGYQPRRLSPESGTVLTLDPLPVALNQVIVSASRSVQERKDAPVAVSILSSKVLEEAKSTSLDQVLNKVSGVYMVDLGNEQHTMAIRQPIGYRGMFLYLEDGLPIRPIGVFNHNALLEMNMAALSRIEVVRGPASALYGSEAIGGAVNFITLRPAAVPTLSASVQGNNIGYRRADLSAGSTFGRLGLIVSGYAARRRDGYREHSDFDKKVLTVRADYRLDDRNLLTWDATYLDYYSDMTGSLDSAFFFSQNYTSQHTFTNRQVDGLRTKLVYQHYWSGEHKTTLTVYFRDNSIRQNPAYRVRDDYSPWGNPKGNPNLAHGEENDQSLQSYGFVAQHRQRLPWLRGAALTGGIQYDHSPSTFIANYISIHKSDEGIYTGFTSTDSLLTDYAVGLQNLAGYLNFDLSVMPRLQLSAALRYDALTYDYDNHLPPGAFSGAPDNTDRFHALTPKAGLTYDLGGGSGLYANYNRGFLPPQVSELYRGVKVPELQPSTFDNYEIGAWINIGKGLAFDASVYRLYGRDEVTSVKLDNGETVNRNAGQTRHYGIEYAINYAASPQWTFRLSGTNARHEYVDYRDGSNNYSGNRMDLAPDWIANAEVAFRPAFLPGARLGVEWQHVGPYFMDPRNTRRYAGYDLVHLRAGYRFGRFEAWINVMNTTDSLYATVAGRSRWGDSYTPGDPRTVNVGFAYRLAGEGANH